MWMGPSDQEALAAWLGGEGPSRWRELYIQAALREYCACMEHELIPGRREKGGRKDVLKTDDRRSRHGNEGLVLESWLTRWRQR